MKSILNPKDLRSLLDSVKKIEGFPTANKEDILNLSEPPNYTACPNPYIKEFIEQQGKPYNINDDNYKKTPFTRDIREGKHHPIYLAHTYHTKVPHQAVQKYIEY